MAEKLLWPPNEVGPFNFLRGMDSYTVPNRLPFGAHQIMQNVALEQQGAAAKRWGYTTYGAAVGTSDLLGVTELVKNDGTKYLIKVSNLGKVYAHPSTQLPIRLAVPYHCTATVAVSGAVGANLATGTKYQYSFVAVDATGKTLGSHSVDSASGQATTGGTAYPITAVAYGVYGAVTYEVYRRNETAPNTWSAWGRMATGSTHATASGITSVTFVDDGNTVPDTGNVPPSSNTTEYTMSTTYKVDFIVVRSSGNNVLLLANGAGLITCDGTSAAMVQPATLTAGGDAITDNRLYDVTNAVYTVRGLHLHHSYHWGCDAQAFPQRFWWTDVNDFTYWPDNATINVPDPRGGRVLDFVTKDDALVIGMTTGVYALWGRIFALSGPATDGTIYFSKVSDVGVASEWSMCNGPDGLVLYEGTDNQPHFIQTLSPVKEAVVEGKLTEQVYPTIKLWTDHANCFGVMHGQEYVLAFPADNRVLRVYFFDIQNSKVRAVVIDAMPTGLTYLCRRLDGTLLGADDGTGQLWELYKTDQYTDNGTAIAMQIKSGSLGCGIDLYVKKFRTLFVTYKVAEINATITVNVYVDVSQVPSEVISITGDAEYDSATYDSSIYARQAAKTSEYPLGQKGHYAVVEFTNSATDDHPIIYGFQLEITPKRRPSGED